MASKIRTKKESGWWLAGLVIGVIFILAILGTLLYFFRIQQPETVLGILMPIVIVALMAVLFIMAAGFARLGLADSQQALGLPEGSVRAMIALFLILIFVTFGLYLFRTVAFPVDYAQHCLTAEQVDALGDRVLSKYLEKDPEACGEQSPAYWVTLQGSASPEGVDLAQQLLNTVGTLVVAIAGFYFGSRAVQVARGVATPDEPKIKNVDPKFGEKGADPINITITGEGFTTVDTVKLVRGTTEIKAIKALSDAKEVVATFKIGEVILDKNEEGKEKDTNFDVVVVNSDGAEDRDAEAFTIKPSSQAVPPAQQPTQPPTQPSVKQPEEPKG